MDWFHCNKCFTKKGSSFAVSSCGHIYCEGCIHIKQCSVCGSSCRYLPITDKMKPKERVFFKDPVTLIKSPLEHFSQIANFQQTQMKRVITHYRYKSVELERRLKDVTEQASRQLSDLQRENSDLKKQLLELRRKMAELGKPLSQRRTSPGQVHFDGNERISLPVAITSPGSHITPRSQSLSHFSSAERLVWSRDRGQSLSSLMTPESAISTSSNGSLHGNRTPTSFRTPTRTQPQASSVTRTSL